MTDSCILPERYDSIEVLSRGTRTSLVRAHDKHAKEANTANAIQSDVAVKVIHVPAWMTSAEADAFLNRTVGTLSRLTEVSHPGVAPIHSIERNHDSLFIAREYVEGRPLSVLMEMRWILGPMEARRIALEIGAALDALRSAGVSHLALTPSNVLVRETGEFVLTDAGISNAAKQFCVAGLSCSLRKRGDTGGDLHALASLVLQALTGLGVDAMDLSMSVELPRGMREPIRRALARDRAAFRSATQFAEALEPVPISRVFRQVWQPAAAVGLLAALATAGGNAVSEARHAAGTAKRHAAPISTAEPVTLTMPRVLETLVPEDAKALVFAVREQGPSVLANPAVAPLTSLSESQRAEITACLADHRDRVRKMVDAAAAGSQIDTAAAMTELRLETNARIVSVLNATQRTRWEQLESDAAHAGERAQ